MSREIKFRAWNISQQKMHLDCGFHPSMASDLAAEDEYYETHEEGRWIISPKFDNYKLMQYTGLKDQDGREIYEGDILKKNYGSSNPYIIVAYDELRAAEDFAEINENRLLSIDEQE